MPLHYPASTRPSVNTGALICAALSACILTLSGCSRLQNPYDASVMPVFVSAPAVVTPFAASADISFQLSSPATVYYIAVVKGASAPSFDAFASITAGGDVIRTGTMDAPSAALRSDTALLSGYLDDCDLYVAAGPRSNGIISTRAYRLSAQTSVGYRYQRSFSDTFSYVGGMAIDSAGYVYIVEKNDCYIRKYTPSGSAVLQFGGPGVGNGLFSQPIDITVDRFGCIYVLDSQAGSESIQKFDAAGTFMAKFGSSGSGDGQFSNPRGIALDPTGAYLYVADYSVRRIQKISSATGAFILKWGTAGTGNGQFDSVMGVAVDTNGNVYTVDAANHNVQKFDANGGFINNWVNIGLGLPSPNSIHFDSMGFFYVNGLTTGIVQKFTADGVFVSSLGSMGTGNGQCNGAHAFAIDALGGVYVGDFNAPIRIQYLR